MTHQNHRTGLTGLIVASAVLFGAMLPSTAGAAPSSTGAAPDCTAAPQLPTFDIVDDDEVLPVTLADGEPVEVAVLDDIADDPETATYAVRTDVALTGLSGPTRIVARRSGPACPAGPTFDATYDVRAAYAPRWNGTGDGAPSPAVDKADPSIVGWITGHSGYTPGGNVSANFQNPENAYGPVGSSLTVLGDRGSYTATFDADITDGPGDDFATFENGFASGSADYLEVAYVEVSSNGIDFVRFDSASRRATPVTAFGTQLASELGGLAGKDLSGKGTPFDLTLLRNEPEVRSGQVDLDAITHVRLQDIKGDGADLDSFGRPIYDPDPVTGSAGYDLTGIAVLNAVEPEPTCTTPLDGAGGQDPALTWLACELELNGDAMPGFSPGTPDYGVTIDAILALSLGGRPNDAAAAMDVLESNIGSYVTDQDFGAGDERYAGALGKSLLVTEIQGEDVGDFGGFDLEAEVRTRMETSGPDAGRFSDLSSFGNFSNGFGQTLSIMGLSYTDAGVPNQAISFLLDQQCPNGGFRGGYDTSGGCTSDASADVDYTSFALQALDSLPQHPRVEAAADRATTWLLDEQTASGALGGATPTASVNTNSTGLAAQALRGVGETAAADAAANWVAQQQLTTANAGSDGGELDLGAIAYDPSVLAQAQASGIPALGRDQWRRSTPQALLAFAARPFGIQDPALVGSQFVPIVPCRVLDTRGSGGAYAVGDQRTVPVSGSCGVPATATAVEASISAVSPSGTGFFRAWPAGDAVPNATQLNYTRNQGTTNTGAVALGDGGALSTRAFTSPTQAVIDVQGYYVRAAEVPAAADGSVYVALSPCRVLDTRSKGGAFAANEVRGVSVAGSGGEFAQQGGAIGGCDVPAAATAVEASVSAVAPGNDGYLRAWPAGAAQPNATFLNYSRNRGTTNTGALALGQGGKLDVANRRGPSHVVIDVQGYFIDPGSVPATATATTFVPASPCRVLDTRSTGGAYADREIRTLGVGGTCQVPVGATAAEASVSAVTPRANGFFRAWPTGTPMPNATQLNYSRAQGTTNTGAIPVAADGRLDTQNYGGPTNVVIDVQGFFVPTP